MPPSALHVFGIDPGGTTGWCRMMIPRDCLFANKPHLWGKAPSAVLEWEYGEITGEETEQAIELARILRNTQGMDYKVGPAAVVEDFSIQINNPTTDSELLSPVRIGAMLLMLKRLRQMSDTRIVFQNRTIHMTTMTDERLKSAGYYVPGPDHIRDAIRIAITALRRARNDMSFRDELWDPQRCSI